MSNDPKHNEEQVAVAFPTDSEVDNLGRPQPEADHRAHGEDQQVTYFEAPAVTFGTDDEDALESHEG
jgi:hypothetical protein